MKIFCISIFNYNIFLHYYCYSDFLFAVKKYVSMSIGSGNTMVEFFSAEIVFKVWKKKYI